MVSPAVKALPAYLKQFVAEQDYGAYTSREHASWRYIMRQNTAFFSKYAVPIYLEGLEKTGISLDQIPRISEMDSRLSEFGWGAVAVEGFIPPAAFLDFQARGVLPIASAMRSVEHIAYTPAPDIVHEAAGHAPVIADPPYATYLKRYASMARKAIFSLEDIRLYEAIRYLSDIKENPDASSHQIQAAEARLKEVSESAGSPSEAAKVARMNWWTVEYGLVGSLENPRIFGAGLLSSVGESQSCLSQSVRKIPLGLGCVDTPYNITEPQPQLFVARDMDHLVEVLEDFEKTLSYRRGGTDGLSNAKAARTVSTTELDSGLQISGVLSDFDGLNFVRWEGPVQLAVHAEELKGHGKSRHPQGFSSPLGRWKKSLKKTTDLSDADLKELGVERGKETVVEYASGFKVSGTALDWHRSEGRLKLVTWGNCTVSRGNEVVFRPEWGEFDLAIGEVVVSVSGGPADRAQYGEFDVGKAPSSSRRTSAFSLAEKSLFECYQELRSLRESEADLHSPSWDRLVMGVLDQHPKEWLLQLELFEAGRGETSWSTRVERNLKQLESSLGATDKSLIQKGLILAKVRSVRVA
jgi:phenylalanine-4-hydroxylase